jgi:hypothetical protein
MKIISILGVFSMTFFNIINCGKIMYKTFYTFNDKNIINKIKHSQNIITNKHQNVFSEKDIELYLHKNEFVKDKKLISISPGGVKGFYLMGILHYIKQNYNLTDYIFSGASAGAWNSLFMCLNKNSNDFIYNILNADLKKSRSIKELEYYIKYKLLKSYADEDFDLNRLFIGVTTIQDFNLQTSIFSDFDNLDDAINCCIASSHIPLVTGGLSNRYHNMYTFDGGFSTYPYLNLTNSVLHVSPNMWKKDVVIYDTHSKIKNKISSVLDLSNFVFIHKNIQNINFIELYDNGYSDAKMNKAFLDNIFIKK